MNTVPSVFAAGHIDGTDTLDSLRTVAGPRYSVDSVGRATALTGHDRSFACVLQFARERPFAVLPIKSSGSSDYLIGAQQEVLWHFDTHRTRYA